MRAIVAHSQEKGDVAIIDTFLSSVRSVHYTSRESLFTTLYDFFVLPSKSKKRTIRVTFARAPPRKLTDDGEVRQKTQEGRAEFAESKTDRLLYKPSRK